MLVALCQTHVETKSKGVGKMTVTLVTGGTSGLGLETARQLAARGHTVYLGARNAEKGAAVAAELGVSWLLMDVTNDAQVAAAAEQLREREGHLDVLVNNAGVSAPRKPVPELTAVDMQQVFDTNVFGIVRVTNAFLPLLERSNNPVVVNVSSGLGSFATVTNPERAESRFSSPVYCSSKAAVTMLTVQYAKALPHVKFNAVDPRSTKTNLNGGLGMQEVGEGVIPLVRMACIDADGPTGTFVDRDGIVPW